jgi:hypothetical protein
MITNELKLKVIDEATKLKSWATQKELEKLNFNLLTPCNKNSCVYGQMTGNCFNERATELLNCCAIPYSSDTEDYIRTRVKSFNSKNRTDWRNYAWVFSAIEFYITQVKAKNNNLINYLKGVKKTLTIEDL